MTAISAGRRSPALSSTPGLESLSIPLVLSCVVPLVLGLAVGGWVRLVASIVAVAAGAGVVADGFLGDPGYPAPGQPWYEDHPAELERAS